MVKHIVSWNLKDKQNRIEDCTKIKNALEALDGNIPGLIKIEVGIDFIQAEGSADVVLYSEFENRYALDSYQIHPDHKAVVPLIKELCCDRRAVDYEV